MLLSYGAIRTPDGASLIRNRTVTTITEIWAAYQEALESGALPLDLFDRL